MGDFGKLVILVFLVLVCTGCVSRTGNRDITVNALDFGDIPKESVGNFDIYTMSFQISNPTNSSFENVDVDITLMPSAAFCHGQTKTFTIPTVFPLMKKTVEVSIAEFSDLDCQYNYTYQVFTGVRY